MVADRKMEMETGERYVYCTSDERLTLVEAARAAGVPYRTTLVGDGPGCYYVTAAGPCDDAEADALVEAVRQVWGACWACWPIHVGGKPIHVGGKPAWD